MISLLLIICRLCLVEAWGHEGHAIVADIAYERLSPSIQEIVTKALFPDMPYNHTQYASPLSAVASWADKVRFTKQYAWTTPLHFVDIRDDLIDGGCPSTSIPMSSISSSANASASDDPTRIDHDTYSNCSFVFQRDCGDGRCAASAIENFSLHLYNDQSVIEAIFLKLQQDTPGLRGAMSKGNGTITKRESLMFLIHIVGDIHQPLHVSRKTDIGGNTIHVSFPQEYTLFIDERNNILHKGWNLHSVWDEAIIEYSMKTQFNNSQSYFQKYIQDNFIHDEDVDEWLACSNPMEERCVSVWSEESFNDALTYAYGDENGNEIQNGAVLTEEYFNTRLPVVQTRLAAAGVRLAEALELIYSTSNVEKIVNDNILTAAA